MVRDKKIVVRRVRVCLVDRINIVLVADLPHKEHARHVHCVILQQSMNPRRATEQIIVFARHVDQHVILLQSMKPKRATEQIIAYARHVQRVILQQSMKPRRAMEQIIVFAHHVRVSIVVMLLGVIIIFWDEGCVIIIKHIEVAVVMGHKVIVSLV